MTENEAWKRYKKRKEARLKARELRKDADGEWITIKGTHVKIGDDGEITGSVADKIKATGKNRKAKKLETSDSMKPQNTDYDFDPRDTFQEFIHKNVEKARPIYEEKGMYGVQEEYYKTRLQGSTKDFKQIDDDDIDAVLDKYIDKGKARLWLQEYDHNVKPALAMQLTANPEVRNAAMNIMYKNYASYCKYAEHKEPLSFEDFLVTPIKIYRGGSGKEYKNPDVFSSYTFSKDVASKFKNSEVGSHIETNKGKVYEAEIRPIDTFGSLNTSGEMEIFVPGFIAPNGKYDSADFNTDASDDEGRYYKWTGEVVDRARTDAEDEENTGRHGNTRIPFGLCQREGIKVQPGWTPQDAWKALEDKGYSVGAVYKELQEKGKTEKESKESPTGFIRSKKVMETLSKKESSIRNQAVEFASAVDKDGNVLFTTSDSEEGSVDVTRHRERLKDSVFTHNHPKGTTFSVEDISCAVAYGVAEMRACHKGGAYSIVRKYSLEDGGPEGYKDFAWDYQMAMVEVKKKTDKIWISSAQTREDAEHCNNLYEGARKRWLQMNAEKYGWEYTEERQ